MVGVSDDYYYDEVGIVNKIVFLMLVLLIMGCGDDDDDDNNNNDNTIVKETPMVLIPAGEFQMGSNDVNRDEKPIHTVYIDAFYIDVYEVTNAQYKKFVRATGHRIPEALITIGEPKSYTFGSLTYEYKMVEIWSDSDFSGDNQPVVGVSWDDAVAYADWSGKLFPSEKRLPTEAEWEKAARGGLIDKKYPWGDSVTHDDANYSGIGGKDKWENNTSPVGSFPQNGYGLYDMAGNVSELCYDWFDYGYYENSPKQNPTGPSSGKFRVVRGGSYNSSIGKTVYYRGSIRIPERNSTQIFRPWETGFRCVQDVPK